VIPFVIPFSDFQSTLYMASRLKHQDSPASSFSTLDAELYPSQREFFERLVDKLNEKEIPAPRIFYKGQSISNHLASVERYIRATSTQGDRRKAAILTNSLDESVQLQLFSYPQYDLNDTNYSWIINTLRHFYGGPDTVIAPRIQLLNRHQKADQSFTDLRVEAYRCWPHEDHGKKEEFLIKAFLHGLADRQLATAIKATKPRSMEDALSHIPKSYRPGSANVEHDMHLRAMMQSTEIQDLKAQVKDLQRQLSEVLQIVKGLSLRRTFGGQLHSDSPQHGRLPEGGTPKEHWKRPFPQKIYKDEKSGHFIALIVLNRGT
jgi:hypothetical protein